jgi:hypothetical protein
VAVTAWWSAVFLPAVILNVVDALRNVLLDASSKSYQYTRTPPARPCWRCRCFALPSPHGSFLSGTSSWEGSPLS